MEWARAFRSIGMVLWVGAVLLMIALYLDHDPPRWVGFMAIAGVALHLFGLFGQPKNKD